MPSLNVQSTLGGLILTHGGLKLLKEYNAVVRVNPNVRDVRVQLLSGGGSGHEPTHAGYVGTGMLSAVICGEEFACPPMAAIVGCLKKVIKQEGAAIFIIMNYPAERLIFGLALEVAKQTFHFENVRMLVVGDDCSIDEDKVKPAFGKRGLAGVVLVHKILGAMADKEMSIDNIHKFGKGLIAKENLATIGFTFELKDGKLNNIEIGKGIHEEPGVSKIDSCDDFGQVIDFIIGKLSVPKSANVVLLVNNFGGTTDLLMNIFLHAFLTKVKRDRVYKKVVRVYYGAFLTSKNHAGISVTVLNTGYSSKILEYLDHKVSVPSTLFKSTSRFTLPLSTIEKVEIYESLYVPTDLRPEYSAFGSKLASKILRHVCLTLITSRVVLNDLDSELGDGDTGSNFEKGAQVVMEHLDEEKLVLKNPGCFLQQISILLQQNMGETAGALYCLLFQGAASGFVKKINPDQVIGIEQWGQALKNGIDKIVEYSLAELGDRTMLDPLREGQRQLLLSIEQKRPERECVECFAEGCKIAANYTRKMAPKAGRAAHTVLMNPEKQYTQEDPGAHAVYIWASAVCDAYKQVMADNEDDNEDD